MAFSYSINPATGRIHIVGRGALDHASAVQTANGLASDPQLQPGMTVLIDLTDLQLSGLTAPPRELVDTVKGLRDTISAAAVVVGSVFYVGMAKMMLGRAEGVKVDAFSDVAKAEQWLDEQR